MPLRARFLLRLDSLAPVGDFSGAGDWPGAHLEPTPYSVGWSPGQSFPLVERRRELPNWESVAREWLLEDWAV